MKVKVILLTGLGFIFLGLGAIGMFIPVWPTTPFVLLAVTCFSSTPHIKARIMKIPFFRDHVKNYENRTGLSKKTVAISLIWLWGMLLLSMILIEKLWISVLLFSIGTAVTIHILCIARPKIDKEK